MSLVKFKAEHLAAIQVQDAQSYASPYMTPEHGRALETTLAFSYIANGVVLAVGGLCEMWPGRATMWSYIDRRAAHHFVGIHRAALWMLDNCPFRRVEADVTVDFAPGHRWLKMLGFELEAPCLRAYLPDGEDCALYARIS